MVYEANQVLSERRAVTREEIEALWDSSEYEAMLSEMPARFRGGLAETSLEWAFELQQDIHTVEDIAAFEKNCGWDLRKALLGAVVERNSDHLQTICYKIDFAGGFVAGLKASRGC